MGFLFFLVVLVAWAFLYSRLRRAEERLEDTAASARSRDSDVIAQLTRRVWALERSGAPVVEEAPVVEREPIVAKPTPVAETVVPEMPAMVIPSEQPASRSNSRADAGIRGVHRVLPPLHACTASPRTAFASTWRDQFRESMGGQEWVAVVGGSWLNKLGVLVLVIGIALLLGYEFTRVGPAGRVITGIGVSLSMLIGAAFSSSARQAYAIFARGYLGGGWAALLLPLPTPCTRCPRRR